MKFNCADYWALLTMVLQFKHQLTKVEAALSFEDGKIEKLNMLKYVM